MLWAVHGTHAACCTLCTVKLIARDIGNATLHHTCVLCRASVDMLEVSMALAEDDMPAPPCVKRMPTAPQEMLSSAVACTPRELLDSLAKAGEDGGELAAVAKSALRERLHIENQPTPMPADVPRT